MKRENSLLLLHRALAESPACAVASYPLPAFSSELRADLVLSRWVVQACHDDAAMMDWVTKWRSESRTSTRPLPVNRIAGWCIDSVSGDVRHESGRFFSVSGIKVRHRQGSKEIEWDQPIIDQPEVGILGILAKRIDGVLHFCLHAKEEPGNIGGAQLSPTVQATYSNYSGVHGGKRPAFLEHFINPSAERLIYARLQSEDGGRFLYKSNRNMIVLADDEVDAALPDDFIWLTLRQIALLLRRDNLINACARSILSSLLPNLAVEAELAKLLLRKKFSDLALIPETASGLAADPVSATALGQTLQWLDDSKAFNHMLVRRVGLKTLNEWQRDGDGALAHRDRRFFRVIGLEIRAEGREVALWSQPILANADSGIIGLLVRERRGRREFLMQAKAEAGNRAIVQLAPTVQFTPGNYSHNPKLLKPFLFAEFILAEHYPLLWQNRQSEEGARFFREDHKHRVLLLPSDEELDLPPDFRWLDEDEVRFLLHLGEQVNSCARSILSCLL